MCSKFLILILVTSQCKSLSQDRSDYEIISESSGESKSLTKELLDLDLGYTVLTDAVLRKNLGASTETLLENEENIETLPDAQPLVQDRDFKLNQFPLTNWDDDKVWGGPSPFFFPDFSGFLRPRPVPASAVRKPPRQTHQTFRHQNRYPQTVPRNSQSAPSKTFVGDQHQCGVGSCEFFLFCWLGGGIIEGNCGGFLFSCCLRPDGGGENSKILASKVSFFWTNDSPSTSMFLSYQTNLFIQKIILFSKILYSVVPNKRRVTAIFWRSIFHMSRSYSGRHAY